MQFNVFCFGVDLAMTKDTNYQRKRKYRTVYKRKRKTRTSEEVHASRSYRYPHSTLTVCTQYITVSNLN